MKRIHFFFLYIVQIEKVKEQRTNNKLHNLFENTKKKLFIRQKKKLNKKKKRKKKVKTNTTELKIESKKKK